MVGFPVLPQWTATGIAPVQGDMQDVASASPFTWGAGGAMLTPDELARRRAIAQGLMKSDYSPISSVWQGLGRVADNVLGAIDSRQLDKQSAAATARSNAVAQALIGKGGGDVAAQAIVDPYVSPEVQALAGKVWDRANPKATAPHYWETNNGSLGMIGPDGKPQILYQDPTPKIDWITAQNADGTKTLVPMQQGGAQGLPTAPVGKLTPIPGGGVSGAGNFPSGNPLDAR